MMHEICEKNKCTGCALCKNVCPTGAINFIPDRYGALYPEIDKDKCINCKLCINNCPVHTDINGNKPISCYAINTKHSEDALECTSGGLSTTFARYIRSNNGYVCGTKYDTDGNLRLLLAECDEDIDLFKGSKYVYAYAGDLYKRVKALLKADQRVLFVGTPCQVDALRRYLKCDYDNLMLIDLVCHGVSTVKFLKDYIREKVGSDQYTSVKFRGRNGSVIEVYQNGSCLYSKNKECDLFYMAYAKGLIFRQNCYTCRYAGLNRCSDITIGDFWGLKRDTLKKDLNGRISLMLINTLKGSKFFDECSELFNYEKRSIEEALPYNGQLNAPAAKNKDRDIFLERYAKNGEFIKALRKTEIRKQVAKTKIISVFIKLARGIKRCMNAGRN